MGADPLGSSQGVPRGGRFVHPVGPCSGFLGMDGWGQQSHDRQIGFHGTPQEGHHAYPVGPSSGYPNRQVGLHGTPQEGHHAYPVGPSSGYTYRQLRFPQWAPQDWHPAYPVGPGSGHSGMQGWGHEFQGVSRQRVRPYERPGTSGVKWCGRWIPGERGTARTILFRWTLCWPKLQKSGWLGRCFAKRRAVRGIGKKGYGGGS